MPALARTAQWRGAASHAALVHVATSDGRTTVVESLIEKGVVASDLEEYLQDKKMRVLWEKFLALF